MVNQYTARQLNDKDRADIVKLYLSGTQTSDLAVMFQRGPRTIRKILEEADVKLRRHILADVPAVSPIELRLHDALRFFGIGFTTHRSYIKGYITDITVNQAKIIIEADGIQHTWDDMPQRDADRDVAHAAIGFRTFRFTGSEILTDAIACIQRVIDECNLMPDEAPVYDVRVNVRGKEHPSYVDDRQQYTCDTCGKEFTSRESYRSRWRTKFCGDYCYQKSKRGKVLTDSHKQALSEAGKGRVISEETKRRISASLKGKTHSPERRAAIAAGRQAGKTPVRTKLSKPLTDEQRQKVSDGMKRYHREKRQAKIESELAGDSKKPAEMTGSSGDTPLSNK